LRRTGDRLPLVANGVMRALTTAQLAPFNFGAFFRI
jgi:hypothetical protein